MEQKKKTITITISESVWRELKKISKETGASVSFMLENGAKEKYITKG